MWAVVLALTDAQALWWDPRWKAFEWMAEHVSQDTKVWASPYIEIPVHKFYPAAAAEKAEFLLLYEGWFYRFGKSELNPFTDPKPDALYHVTARERHRYKMLLREWEEGRLVMVQHTAPPEWLPEQIGYTWFWGHLNKFAGECILLKRVTLSKNRDRT